MEIQAYSSMATLRNAIDQSQIGADIIQQTIQHMNQYQHQNGQANQQDVQTSVLQAQFSGQGQIINKLV